MTSFSISNSDLAALFYGFSPPKKHNEIFPLTTIFFNFQTRLQCITMWQLFRISSISRFMFLFFLRLFLLENFITFFTLFVSFSCPHRFDCCLFLPFEKKKQNTERGVKIWSNDIINSFFFTPIWHRFQLDLSRFSSFFRLFFTFRSLGQLSKDT